MSLYPDQLEAAEDFQEWLNSGGTLVAGLWASAGFGKSFCAKHLIEEVVLKNSNYNPVIASMTHSAVDVLTSFIGREVNTLHSLMGWVPMVNKDTGDEYLSTPEMRDKNAEPRLKPMDLVIVDEAGLLGHRECDLLMEQASMAGARILFIGDNKQCFPVIKDGERLCVPAYEATNCYLELTIPKRVDEGDMIYKLSLAYRATVDGKRQPKLRTMLNPDDSGKGVRHVDDIEEYAYLAFNAAKEDGEIHKVKVLCFTNQRALSINRKVRKKVMGISSGIPTAGEEMIANTSITDSTDENVLIRNNQKLIVQRVEETTSYGLKGAFIEYADLDGEIIEEILFVPESPMKLNQRLKDLAKKAKAFKLKGEDEKAAENWRAFYSLKAGCADIRYTYAMTINKAQGTTLKHALVDMYDINSCRDKEQKARLAYTAVSRPTDYLTIEGELDG